MPIELECKLRLASREPVRAALQAAGAAFIGRVLETNRLFDRDDGALQKAGCGLRVRSISILDGKGPSDLLTYKGPRRPGAFKCREEVNIAIADAEAMTRILLALGFAERIIFEKRRESWQLHACRIELDELPRLGLFLEVEGPDEAAIRETLSELDLDASAHVTESYVSMIAALAGPAQPAPIALRFD